MSCPSCGHELNTNGCTNPTCPSRGNRVPILEIPDDGFLGFMPTTYSECRERMAPIHESLVAIAMLLYEKGIFTEEEYDRAVIQVRAIMDQCDARARDEEEGKKDPLMGPVEAVPGTAESDVLVVPLKFDSGTARMTEGEEVTCAVCGSKFRTDLVITYDDVGGPVCDACQEKEDEETT